MGEQHKTPEQVEDEDYKVAPTSADKNMINKERREEAIGENYDTPSSLEKPNAKHKTKHQAPTGAKTNKRK